MVNEFSHISKVPLLWETFTNVTGNIVDITYQPRSVWESAENVTLLPKRLSKYPSIWSIYIENFDDLIIL